LDTLASHDARLVAAIPSRTPTVVVSMPIVRYS
jgi:hypothetical protein